MTRQQIFDAVCNALIRQGRRSLGLDGNPRIFAEDGAVCPVGVFMPKDKYRREFDLVGVYGLVNGFRYKPSWLIDNLEMFADLLKMHDRQQPFEWRRELREIARKYELKVDAIDALEEI